MQGRPFLKADSVSSKNFVEYLFNFVFYLFVYILKYEFNKFYPSVVTWMFPTFLFIIVITITLFHSADVVPVT